MIRLNITNRLGYWLRRRSRVWLCGVLAMLLCLTIGLGRGAIAAAVSSSQAQSDREPALVLSDMSDMSDSPASATQLRLQGQNRQALAVVFRSLGIPDTRTRNLQREDFPVLTLMALGLDQPQDLDGLDRDTFNQRLQTASEVTLSIGQRQQLRDLADIFQAIGERDLVKPLLEYLLAASQRDTDRLALHERLGQFYLSQGQWHENYQQADFIISNYEAARKEYGQALNLAQGDRLAMTRLQLASLRVDLAEHRYKSQRLMTGGFYPEFDASITSLAQDFRRLYRDVIDAGTTPNAIAMQLELASQLACLQSFATPVTLGVAVSPTIRHCIAPHWTEPRPIVDQLLADRRALLDYAIETIADLNDRLPPIDPEASPQPDPQASLPTVIGHRLWAEALLLRGEVAEAEGLTPAIADRFISQTKAGLMMAHRVGATDLSVQLLWQAGRMASRSGDPTTARPYYAQAIAELEQLRIDLGSLDTDWRYDFRDAIAPLYRDYLAFLLPAPEASLLGNYSEDSGLAVPSDPVDLKTAIGVLQRLQLAELDDFFGEACAVPKRFSIEDWEKASEEKYRRTALLTTVVLDDRTETIIAFPDPEAETSPQWLRYSNPLDQGQVKTELHSLRELLGNSSFASQGNLARRLPEVYDRFFREAIAALEQSTASTAIDTILFLPDGGFRNIPLGTLRPKDGDYLIQRYTIAVIPSFDLIATEAEGRSRSRLRTLAVGRTIFDNDGANTTTNNNTTNNTTTNNTTNNTTTEDRSFRSFSRPQVLHNREDLSFPNLLSVKLEIVSIADLLPQSSYLLDTDFLSDTFAETIASRRYDIAHIATHGSFGALADQTFIVAQDGLISFDRLGQILRSNDPTRETDLDLVILSACQTAEGSDRAVLGMAGMGLRAGVRSTIGSLWNVNDLSTSLIMQAFYRHRLEGLGKAEALAAAQRDALNGDLDPPTVTGTAEPGMAKDFSSPYYWSPFVLVGDW